MRRPASHTSNSRQRGGALMVMLVILVLGVTAALISSLRSNMQRIEQERITAAALAQAKEALIGYAVSYGDKNPAYPYGYLPCPDVDETGITPEGSEHGNCGVTDASALSRLPWKTLGLPIPRDAYSECLWYAVSGNYKNNPKSAATMNWDNTGKLRIFAADGNEILPGEIVAVVISPGSALQNRGTATAPLCGGNYTASSYLDHDTAHNINNADIAAGKFILPHVDLDANGNILTEVNDQFVYITRADIWQAIQHRIVAQAKSCLDDYAATAGGKYPWAVPVSTSTAFAPLMLGAYNTRFGRIPPQPNVQLEPIPPIITTMQARFGELWTALDVFANNKTATNLAAMKTRAGNAKSAADTVGNAYEDSPLGNAADSLKNAADDAQDNLTTSSSNAAITAIKQALVNSAQAFSGAMPTEFSQASGMPTVWPSSCSIYSSPYWEQWKDLLFYHVADGFQPGSSGSCGNCLSLTVDGFPFSGSGGYHAVVIAAGRQLTASRTTTQLSDYLESDNLLPQSDPNMPYQTYRQTDSHHSSNNDLVLCLDGKVNCK